MKRDRFLFGILLGIGVLIAAALILFFTRQGQDAYGEETTPAGVVHNYILAVQKRDYARAYRYLAETPEKPTLTEFQQAFLSYQAQAAAHAVAEIGTTMPDDLNQTAVVQVTILQTNQGLFNDINRDQSAAMLVRQNGTWKITAMPYPYTPPNLPKAIPPVDTPTPSPTFTAPAPNP